MCLANDSLSLLFEFRPIEGSAKTAINRKRSARTGRCHFLVLAVRSSWAQPTGMLVQIPLSSDLWTSTTNLQHFGGMGHLRLQSSTESFEIFKPQQHSIPNIDRFQVIFIVLMSWKPRGKMKGKTVWSATASEGEMVIHATLALYAGFECYAEPAVTLTVPQCFP